MKFITAVIFILMLICFAGYSEEQNNLNNTDDYLEIIELDDIVVTATRTNEEILDVPEHITVVTAVEIEQSGANNIADVLGKQAGLSIIDYGANGALQTVSIRGAKYEQVLILLDGARLNNAREGGADLSMIPLEMIERIEVVRGGMSVLYGADAIGGVINIITKKEANEDTIITVTVENGSYIPQKHITGQEGSEEEHDVNPLTLIDTQKYALQYSQNFNFLNINLTGSFTMAENGFVFKDGNDLNRYRENADYLGGDAMLSLYFPFEKASLNITQFYLQKKFGTPGWVPENPSLESFQEDQKIRSTINFKTDRFFTDILSFASTAYFEYSKLNYEDPYSPGEHKLYSTGGDIVQQVNAFDFISFVYGGNINYNYSESTLSGNRERLSGGVFLEVPLYIKDRITIQPSVRFDYYSDFNEAISFKLGMTYRLSSSSSLKTSFAHSYRAPTINDLYWSEPWMEGNPDLKPETGYDIDLGYTKINDSIEFNVFGYIRILNDLIDWTLWDDGVYRPSNLDKVLFPGLETDIKFKFLDYFSINASYTFNYSFYLSEGYKLEDNKRMTNKPVHEAGIGFQFNNDTNIVGFDGKFMGLRYTSADNSSYVPAFFVMNAYYKRNLGEYFILSIGIDNIFNEQYRIINEFPMPGTMITTGITVRF